MNKVTPEHLRQLATVDKASLFRGADTLIDSDEGIIAVPFEIVSATIDGQTKLTTCRLLYSRSQFIEDGIVTGKAPRTVDGASLEERLALIAAGLNEDRRFGETAGRPAGLDSPALPLPACPVPFTAQPC